MKKTLLPYLVCLNCGTDFTVTSTVIVGEEIVEGALVCAHDHTVPVLRGVPRFVQASHPTAHAFAYSWKSFPDLRQFYEQQFLDWLGLVTTSAFVGKAVLDAGCGKGRHLGLAAQFGAQDAIGVDFSDAVDLAWEHTHHLSNAHVIQADLGRLPLKPAFHLIYSLGVIHHLDHPQEGYVALSKFLRPHGLFAVWVYAREGNGWIVHIMDPLRKFIFSPMPHALLRIFALIPTVMIAIWSSVVSIFHLLGINFSYYQYLCAFHTYPFCEKYSIVLDHLIPPVAYYLPGEEVRVWPRTAGLTLVSMDWFRNMSWRMHAIKE